MDADLVLSNQHVRDAVDRIVLGTAQLAADYGIANTSGTPARDEAFKLLSTAWESGIRRYDTAPAYGSEGIIGEFVTANGINEEIIILTKIPRIDASMKWREEIQRSVEKSLSRLKASAVEVLFFHNAENARLLDDHASFFDSLMREQPIRNLGISAYVPEDLSFAEKIGFEIAYQFPSNIFDTRFANIELAAGRRYSRSLFLQGVLSPGNSLRENAPAELVDFHKKYHEHIRSSMIDPISIAISAVMERKWVDYMIIGAERKEQLDGILSTGLISEPEAHIPRSLWIQAQALLDPRKW